MEIHASARKHGVADRTSFTRSTMHSHSKTLAKTPTDGCSSALEVVIMITADGTQLVIRAMPMRDRYRRLLGL